MPKLKTNKSAQKRIARRAGGKLMLRKMSITHRARFKSKRAKRQAAKKQVIGGLQASKLRQLINLK